MPKVKVWLADGQVAEYDGDAYVSMSPEDQEITIIDGQSNVLDVFGHEDLIDIRVDLSEDGA